MSFGKDIEKSLHHLVMDGAPSIDMAVKEYNQTLTMLLNKHAPLKNKHIKPRKLQPWFTDKIRDEIQIRQTEGKTVENDPSEYIYNASTNKGAL